MKCFGSLIKSENFNKNDLSIVDLSKLNNKLPLSFFKSNQINNDSGRKYFKNLFPNQPVSIVSLNLLKNIND